VPLPEKHAPLVKLLELIAARIGVANFPAQKRYDDASWVGYRLAELLPLPLSIKQSMLEINDAGIRLDVLSQFLAKQGLI
jgi:Lon protease-like protein